jgi:hypothetical protein
MEFFSADLAWLFFAYTLGTLFGLYFGFKGNVHNLSEKIIDSLIEEGFLKTRGYGKNMEILKPEEWCDDQNSR